MMMEEYLVRFLSTQMKQKSLCKEIDRVWEELHLNNKIPLTSQIESVRLFYAHPVWKANSLFSMYDPISQLHRNSIAHFIKSLDVLKIADYGGGSGELCKKILQFSDCALISLDVIEPYIDNKVDEYSQIAFRRNLEGYYDLIIAQDVLEHLDNPLEVIKEMIDHLNDGGFLLFANCFYPIIKCHLPSNFYLRHIFPYIMKLLGFSQYARVLYAEHAVCWRMANRPNFILLVRLLPLLKIIGSLLNCIAPIFILPLRFVRGIRRRLALITK
jgi:2-polyprenyl-3-methyl-5-hydroxy-6-metoxy-1,4-benzoquinol methylase